MIKLEIMKWKFWEVEFCRMGMMIIVEMEVGMM